jgi:hypothetical protein
MAGMGSSAARSIRPLSKWRGFGRHPCENTLTGG